MTKLSYKQSYSRKVYYARHLRNMARLNDFLGRNLLKHQGADEEDLASSEHSISVEGLEARANKGTLTYKTLLEHIQVAENNYNEVRARHGAGRRNNRGGDDGLQSAASQFRPRSNYGKFA